MATDFLEAMPLTTDTIAQMSALPTLCHLQQEIEKANGIVDALENVKCGKTFYIQLKEYINKLQSNILNNLPKIPTEDNLIILSKACLINNSKINTKALNIIHTFVTKNKENKFKITLFANDHTFALFNNFLSNNNNNLKILVIECLQIILSHGFTFTNTYLITLLIEHIHSTDTTLQNNTMELIQTMCHKKHTQYRTIFLDTNIINSLRKFYESKYLSYDLIHNISVIVERLCKQKKLFTGHFYNLLETLKFIIYFDDNYTIECALIGYSYLFNQDAFNDSLIILHNRFNTNTLKAQYSQQSVHDNIIFNNTIKQYEKDISKTAVPTDVKKVIKMYYYTFNTAYVSKIDFCLLKRFVELLGNEYQYYVKRCSLACIKALLGLPGKEAVFKQMVFFGLLNKLEVVLRCEMNDSVLEKALWVVLVGVFHGYFRLTNWVQLMYEINRISKNYDVECVNELYAFDIMANGLQYACKNDMEVVWDNGFATDFVSMFLRIIKCEKLDDALWRTVTSAIENILKLNDNISEISVSVRSQLGQCSNLSEVHKDNVKKMYDFMGLLTTKFKLQRICL